ncbi:divalent-cation tolerance protein CutA [Kineococcus arenarius]|uniref:divalent-cation tolerance protein CutA n=1 Tax=unclassified Kineococcus TaxID=2621656 RepID=UPI003D7E063D
MSTDPDECCEVVITGPDAEWMVAFTRRLVEDRLVACGHHLTPIRSVYRWQDAIEDETETRVALHTRTSLVPEVIERTNTEHPYEVPCVIATPLVAGNPAYLDWIVAETREPADRPASLPN